MSEASRLRQQRKLAAVLRQPDEPGAVRVNSGSDEELVEALMSFNKFKREIAVRIVQLRPFQTKTEMLERVNEGIDTPQARLGPHWMRWLTVGDTPAGLAVSSAAEDEKAAYLPKRRGPKKKSSDEQATSMVGALLAGATKRFKPASMEACGGDERTVSGDDDSSQNGSVVEACSGGGGSSTRELSSSVSASHSADQDAAPRQPVRELGGGPRRLMGAARQARHQAGRQG